MISRLISGYKASGQVIKNRSLTYQPGQVISQFLKFTARDLNNLDQIWDIGRGLNSRYKT